MDPIALRALERLLAVVIGGVTVYLGYRLFLAMPEQRDGEGKLELPGGVSIYISRVGPGVFFSLFGSAVVGLAIQASMTVGDPSGREFSWMSESTDVAVSNPRLELEFLNELPTLLRDDLDEEQRRNVEPRVERLKLAVMRSAWTSGLGSFDDFRSWWDEGAFDPVPPGLEEAAALYRAGSPDGP